MDANLNNWKHNTVKWFQHQARARSDAKLQKVLIKYGAVGYGLYWYCIECICDNLEPRLTFELEQDAEILAHNLKIDTLLVNEIMRYMLNIGLFTESEGVIFCRKLACYLGDNITRNDKLKAIIKEEKAASSDTVSDSLRLYKQEERRGEERKREESKALSTGVDRTALIFDHWVQVMGKSPSQTLLTPKRKKAVQERLKQGYTENQIREAIDNCRADPWSMGQNDRRTAFNDLELICRSGEHLERFLSKPGNNRPDYSAMAREAEDLML